MEVHGDRLKKFQLKVKWHFLYLFSTMVTDLSDYASLVISTHVFRNRLLHPIILLSRLIMAILRAS